MKRLGRDEIKDGTPVGMCIFAVAVVGRDSVVIFVVSFLMKTVSALCIERTSQILMPCGCGNTRGRDSKYMRGEGRRGERMRIWHRLSFY